MTGDGTLSAAHQREPSPSRQARAAGGAVGPVVTGEAYRVVAVAVFDQAGPIGAQRGDNGVHGPLGDERHVGAGQGGSAQFRDGSLLGGVHGAFLDQSFEVTPVRL
jgi:hypothetical protein